jgi:hypothetical protein
VSIQLLKKHIGQAEREIPLLVYGYYVFQNPPYKASRQLLIPRIAAIGTSISPLPCQAWHGYGVTCACNGPRTASHGKGEPPSPAEAHVDLEQDYPEGESLAKKGGGARRGREVTTVEAICSDS